MQAIRLGCLTHLVSKNKKVGVWHCKFGHASNTKIIRISKLLMDIKNFNNIYDLIKVYNNLEQSGLDDNNDHIKNPEKPVKVEKHSNNDPKSPNLEELAAKKRHSNKHFNKHIDFYLTT